MSIFHYFLTGSWHLNILLSLFPLLFNRLLAFWTCFNLRQNSFINWESIYWVSQSARLLDLGYTEMSKIRCPVLDSLLLRSSWFNWRDRFLESSYLNHNMVGATVVLSSVSYLEIRYPQLKSFLGGPMGSFFSHGVQKGEKNRYLVILLQLIFETGESWLLFIQIKSD